eukprot:gene18764-21355_t
MGGSGDPPVYFWLSNETIVSIFSFMGGYVDAVSYMKLFGIFTTMVTGNIIAASTTGFREGDESAIVRVLITAVFAAGIFTSSSLYLILRHIVKINRWSIGIILFTCEAFALAIATIVGVYLEYKASGYPHVGSWQVLLIAGLLSWAMGIHCAATQDKLTESKKHLLERVEQIVIFAAGVIAGAVLAEHIGFFSIALPTALIVATVVNIKISQIEHFKRQTLLDKSDVVNLEITDTTEASSGCA